MRVAADALQQRLLKEVAKAWGTERTRDSGAIIETYKCLEALLLTCVSGVEGRRGKTLRELIGGSAVRRDPGISDHVRVLVLCVDARDDQVTRAIAHDLSQKPSQIREFLRVRNTVAHAVTLEDGRRVEFDDDDWRSAKRQLVALSEWWTGVLSRLPPSQSLRSIR